MNRSSVLDLAPEDRAWLDATLINNGFRGYQALEDELRARGYVISRSALHRYGQPLQKRLLAIKASTEAARMITEGAADDQDARSEAVLALVQTEMFETLVNLQDAVDESTDTPARIKMLSNAARSIATMSRASVNLKRYRAEWAEKARAAAESVREIGQRAAISPEVLAEITERIYGLAA